MKQEEVWVPSTQVSAPDDYINGHGYVDLGLPSGRKWATCNVGASASQDYGDYFAWGETTIKRNYSWPNSITYEKDYSFLQQSGIIDNSEDLTTKHDAAQVNWGDNWQIPSYSDFKELIDECHWEKTSINGKNGFKVIGPNNKSIFFPATGRMKYSHKYFEGLDCEYWSRTIDNEHPKYATAFWIREHDNEPFPIWCDRYEGRTIRPVVK